MALLAAGGLAYEIALTRLLSTLLVSSWVAPVLAVALLGAGLGAALAALTPALRSPLAARVAAASAAVLAVLALPAWLWAAGRGTPLLGLALPLLAYLASGLASAAILSWRPQQAPWLLRADYGAAALAAALTPWLLGLFGLGALGVAVAAAALPALAALVLSGSGARAGNTDVSAEAPTSGAAGQLVTAVSTAGVAAVALAALAVAVGALGVDPERHLVAKPISQLLARGGVVETTRWDATARTDLVRLPNGARYLYMDGGAGSLIPTPDPNDWSRDVGAFAFAMAPAESAFLIGSGGGLDVAQARAHGVQRVVAVEVNPASVDLVRELGASTGLVYEDPTAVVIGDGRRVLAGSDETFDVITLANVVTGAAELRGAALTENRVYTVEAFVEYLQHLNPDGRLVLKLYDELTLTRALTTALAALVEGGYATDVSSAASHLFSVLETTGGNAVPVLVVQRSPFSAAEAVAAARVAEQRGWALLLVPGLLAPPTLQPLVDGEMDLSGLIAATNDVDLQPTRDRAPFFFSFEPGVPRAVQRAGVLVLLVLALAATAVLLWAGRGGANANTETGAASEDPVRANEDTTPTGGSGARHLLSALALGAGFLLVELHALPVIQAAAGQPAWSLSLTLGSVLLGGAIGAQLANRQLSTRTARAATGAALEARTWSFRLTPRTGAFSAAVTVLIWSLLAPPLTAALAGLEPLASSVLLAVTLLLATIPLGLPFPLLLASFRRSAETAAALALSGIAAVAAGAGALWLAHALGAPAVGLVAAASYLIAGLLAGGRSASSRALPADLA